MKKALIENGVVTFVSHNPEAIFDAATAERFIDCDEAVQVGWLYADGEYSAPPVVEPEKVVPASITMRQARLQLHAIGKLSAVQAAINQLPEPPKTSAQIEWDYAAVVERASPFVALLTPALGLSDEEMDELFIQASKL